MVVVVILVLNELNLIVNYKDVIKAGNDESKWRQILQSVD